MTSSPRDPTVLLDAGPTGTREQLDLGVELEGRFRLRARLGSGGMGVVVEADDLELGRLAAVKRVPDRAPPSQTALLAREARIQGRLDHPAIPPVYEVGRDAGGRVAFAMRRVGGSTLGEILSGRRTGAAVAHGFSIERLLRIFVEVCQAIGHAHQRGVIHCDLKPGNVMIDPDERVYVIDWGVATVLDPDAGAAAPPTGRVGGTIGYMAPEQLEGGRAYDGRVDVYSLGCILFEILAGEPLHARREGVIDAILAGVDARPSQRAGATATPAALDAICVRATARDPARRHATAVELAADVIHWLDHAHDRAVRVELARGHLDRARLALVSRDPTDRASALAAASQALALTPDDPAAVAMVQELLRSDELPEGARSELLALDDNDERKLAGAAALSYLGFGLFPITLFLHGGVQLGFLAAQVIGWLVLELVAISVARGGGPRSWLWWSIALLAFESTMFARYLGPFVVTTALAALSAAGAMMHPRVHHRVAIAGLLCLPPLLPFVLERAGVLSSTFGFGDGAVRLRSAVSGLDGDVAVAGLLSTAVALVLVGLLLGRAVAAPAHRARRQLAVQAWHLERMLAAASEDREP